MHQDANDPNSGDAYELNSIEHRKSNGAERYAEARASMDQPLENTQESG